MLEVKNLSVRYGRTEIVKNVSFTVREGEWLMIAGPNGAGKSTIVRALAQNVPYTGSIVMDGNDVKTMKPAARARQMGVLMQSHSLNYGFTVEEIVRLGRYAHNTSLFSANTREDEAAINEALEITGLTPLRNQSVLTVSGGEMQRAFLAQLLCQNPRLMILDEPTNHLDLKYQKQIFALVKTWLEAPGRAVISVVHDLSLARACGTHALLLNEGKAYAQGEIQTVLTAQNLNAVYEMDVGDWMRGMLSQWI